MDRPEVQERILDGVTAQDTLVFRKKQSRYVISPRVIFLTCDYDGQGVCDAMMKLQVSLPKSFPRLHIVDPRSRETTTGGNREPGLDVRRNCSFGCYCIEQGSGRHRPIPPMRQDSRM